jgi:cysteinyl-tRNA synthetase
VQFYTDRYHANMKQLNVLSPSIEPRASGHNPEQIETIQKIMEAGYAYEINGSVYFDVDKYNKDYHYGKLSGRVFEDLLSATRELDGQEEKRCSADFALWKKAQPVHIMRWNSPWSQGFPGWHIECSAMSTRYLGKQFDIHGGGMDLLFPHHESEIAQSPAANGKEPCRYWIHNNLITVNGQKMGKSLNNFINLDELFTGKHPLLTSSYSPMTIRFFILQAHYRGQLDFSNEALHAAEKGLKKLLSGMKTLEQLPVSETSSADISSLRESCYQAMNDDFNSPILIASLFEAVRIVNSVNDKHETLTASDISVLRNLFQDFVVNILGLQEESNAAQDDVIGGLMQTILEIRQEARVKKDFATSDKIRDHLAAVNIQIKDGKDGTTWIYEN